MFRSEKKQALLRLSKDDTLLRIKKFAKQFYVTRAIEPTRKTVLPISVNGNKIFVGGIPLAVTEEEFLEYFGQFGRISGHIFPANKTNDSMNRGYAFVIYESSETVSAVLSFVKNHVLRAKVVG